MDEFENKIINGIHTSRYIASWINKGGSLDRHGRWMFKDWLKVLIINGRNLTDEEIDFIYKFATNGKMELEMIAGDYMS